MKKIYILLLVSVFFLSGCLKIKEHLKINQDNTGTLEVEEVIPQGTIYLFYSTFRNMAQDMLKAIGKQEQTPESLAEEMFADKNTLQEKAKKTGLNIVVDYFNTERADGNLLVKYKIQFDDAQKLADSGIMVSPIKVSRDAAGNLVCALKNDTSKLLKESEVQREEFKKWKLSEGYRMLEPEERKKMLEGLKDFQLELLLTLPDRITKSSGFFTGAGPDTVSVSLAGNILEDPAFLENIFASQKDSIVISGEEGQAPIDTEVTVGSPVELRLKTGRTLKGTFMEKNSAGIKINYHGIPMTFSNGEIDRLN